MLALGCIKQERELLLLDLTRGEVEMARVPTEAFSSSTVDTVALSGARGLILILNFFPGSSSPSDSLDEKNVLALTGGGDLLKNAVEPFSLI